MALETPRDPPPFMANAILNFHFDYLTPSLNGNIGNIQYEFQFGKHTTKVNCLIT